MRTHAQNKGPSIAGKRGTTLIELTVVIAVLLAMIGATMYFGGNIKGWRLGKEASESLRAVYAAQRAFLADHPRRTLVSLTSAELVPYLPDRSGVMPTIKSLDGASLAIDVKLSPPICRAGDGTAYDPSGAIDDSLWDVGS